MDKVIGHISARGIKPPKNADVARENGRKTLTRSNRDRALAFRYGQVDCYCGRKKATK